VILCRVLGNSVATVRHSCYDGHKVMVVQPVRSDGATALGASFLAVDSVQSGVGDLVLCAREGNTARQILGNDEDPFHSVVLAVVDMIVHGDQVTEGPGPS
jgi:microcompartment protein CcmK/EutM